MPTGGPYVDLQPLLDKAVAIVQGYGVPDPEILDLRFTTYCDAMLRNGMPLGTYVNRYREVWEVSIQHLGGDMIIPRNPDLVAGPFPHSFYIFDANDGFPLTWVQTAMTRPRIRALAIQVPSIRAPAIRVLGTRASTIPVSSNRRATSQAS